MSIVLFVPRNKSSMQVVLWKPPERFIEDVVKEVSGDKVCDKSLVFAMLC